jgi:hypothetical protein
MNELDAFGRFVTANLRDKAFDTADQLLEGRSKAPRRSKLQADLARLTAEQRDVARRLVRSAVDSAIHDFLFALQEINDRDQSIQVLARGANVAAKSDGLQGEPSGDQGWDAKFSRHGQAPQQAATQDSTASGTSPARPSASLTWMRPAQDSTCCDVANVAPPGLGLASHGAMATW